MESASNDKDRLKDIEKIDDPYASPEAKPDNELFGYWTGRILPGETISKAWVRYKGQLPRILLFSLNIAGACLWYIEIVKDIPAYLAYVLLVLLAVLILIVDASLVHLIHKDEGVAKALVFGIKPRNFISIITSQILMTTSTIGGLGAFILPGFTVFSWGLFAPFINIDEKKIGFAAMARSRDYAEGHMPGITATMFPLMAVFFVLAFPEIIMRAFGMNLFYLPLAADLVLNIVRFSFIAFALPFIFAAAEEIYKQAKDIRPNAPDRVNRQREAPFIMASALGALLLILLGIYSGFGF